VFLFSSKILVDSTWTLLSVHSTPRSLQGLHRIQAGIAFKKDEIYVDL
jgi:hypothetical protein